MSKQVRSPELRLFWGFDQAACFHDARNLSLRFGQAMPLWEALSLRKSGADVITAGGHRVLLENAQLSFSLNAGRQSIILALLALELVFRDEPRLP